jgi:hypothetical protein
MSCNLLALESDTEGKVATTPTISSIIAGIQVQEAVKLLHGLPVLAGKGFIFEGLNHTSYKVEYTENAECMSHYTFAEVVRLQEASRELTLAQLLAQARRYLGSEDVVLEFSRDVRPILQQHCYECHGPEKQKSGYRLDVRDIALKGGDSGNAAILPHDAQKSPLIRFVSGEDEDMVMPPKKSKKPRLTTTEVEVLRAWINEGPAWPDEFAGSTKDAKPYWSLTPLALRARRRARRT